MLFAPYKRLFSTMRDASVVGTLLAIAWVPIIRVTGDVAKMLGYPRGLKERLLAGSEEGLMDAGIEPHRRPADDIKQISVD